MPGALPTGWLSVLWRRVVPVNGAGSGTFRRSGPGGGRHHQKVGAHTPCYVGRLYVLCGACA